MKEAIEWTRLNHKFILASQKLQKHKSVRFSHIFQICLNFFKMFYSVIWNHVVKLLQTILRKLQIIIRFEDGWAKF